MSNSHLGKFVGEKSPWYGKKHTEETKKHLSEVNKGENNPHYGKKCWNDGAVNKFSIECPGDGWILGKKHTEETKQKQREALQGEKNHMYGKTPSEETKQKQREALQGEKHPSSKTVYQYDMENTLVRTFASTREAARHLGKKHGNAHISLCARGLSAYDYIYGFKWSYHDNEANKFAAR